MANKRKPLNLKKYKYATEYLQDVDKEKKGIPTRGRMPKLERSLVTKKRVPTIKARPGPTKVKPTKKELEMDRQLRLQDMAPNVYKMIKKGQTSKKMGGGKVEKRFIGGLVRKGITKLLSKTPKPKTKLKSKETSADRIGNPRGKKNITRKQKKPINSSDLIFPMAAGTAYAASKNTKKKKAGGKVEYKMGGGKVKYRSIGGKVIDGNDITKMIYD